MSETIKTLADFKKEIENPAEAFRAYVAHLASTSDKSTFKK